MAHSETQEYRSSESDVHRVEAVARDRSVVCIDTHMYMLHAEARKQALGNSSRRNESCPLD